jgi:hypothetical protein
MKTYPRSAYKNPFPADVNRNNAKSRGWGPGWPNCQTNKMKTVAGGGIRLTVREEIAEMVLNLVVATDKIYNLLSGSCGAYNCRAIRGTNTASNHSWGLAVDLNWNNNPMSTTFHSEIPPEVVAMWESCGWFWGGHYNTRFDTMHFEYIGSPDDVKAHTARAKKFNGVSTPTPDPKPPVTDQSVPAAVVVSLNTILKAAAADPKSLTGKAPSGTKTMVSVVENALVAEGHLDKQYADGLFGSKTIGAYKGWQQALKYTGSDADGLPGLTSLKKLGDKHGFEVVK